MLHHQECARQAAVDQGAEPIQPTGRALDVAVKGEGYVTVQAADGTEAYTRDGSFDVTPEGTLVTRFGLPVAGEGGPLTIPANSTVSFGADGTVTATPAGGGAAQTVGRLKLVKPTDETPLKKGTDGLLRPVNGEDLPAENTVRIVSGSLEGSNVNVVEAMVDMISAARQFETQMKLLQNAEQNDQRAAQLLAAR